MFLQPCQHAFETPRERTDLVRMGRLRHREPNAAVIADRRVRGGLQARDARADPKATATAVAASVR
jgi:hypothetical protein